LHDEEHYQIVVSRQPPLNAVDGYQYPLKDGAGIIQSKIHNYSL